jgi:sugar lactone lactonase YvrE
MKKRPNRARLLRTIRNQCGLAAACLLLAGPALADQEFLTTVKKHHLLTSTQPANGDQNPYALVVAPVSAGTVQKNDVLVDNFNDNGNLQGTGSTIIDYRPSTGQMDVFAAIPHDLPGCPGGIGLTTAMTMLKSGWVIVGSAPSTDGTTKTLGAGCLIVLDSRGHVAGTIAGPQIDDPWGNMAVFDNGDTATLFVSNAGFGIGAPGQPVQHKATVLRLDLAIGNGKPPAVTSQTVIGDGFGAQADAGVFLIGPTGLALGPDGTLYVSDAIGNRIVAIADAAARADSAGQGRTISKDGMLARPLAMGFAANGHLLVVNGLNGQVVEIDPASGKQEGAMWIDADEAQTPPGSGDLFGITMMPDGKGFYYVEDDVNALVQAQ